MNKQQAIDALVALPGVTSISKADVGPEDVLIVECDQAMSSKQVEDIRLTMQQIWPNRKIAVFDRGIRLKVGRNGE